MREQKVDLGPGVIPDIALNRQGVRTERKVHNGIALEEAGRTRR